MFGSAVDSVTEAARGVARVVSRATLVPLSARSGVCLSGLVAMAVAYPGWVLLSRPGWLLLVVPAVPALMPRGRATSAVVLLAVAGWLVTTAVDGGRVPLWRLLALAGALYLMHTLAALAAALPYDAVTPTDVFTRWVARALAVLLVSAVLAVVVLAAVGRTGDRALLVAALLGLGVAVALTGLLSWLWRSR